jgi:hypothetical protein
LMFFNNRGENLFSIFILNYRKLSSLRFFMRL